MATAPPSYVPGATTNGALGSVGSTTVAAAALARERAGQTRGGGPRRRRRAGRRPPEAAPRPVADPDYLPPDARYIEDLYKELQVRYGTQDTQIERMRANRELAQGVPIDEDMRVVPIEVLDPTITDEIGRVTASLALNPPIMQCTPGDPASDEQQENATLRETVTEQILNQAGYSESGLPTLDACIDSCAGDGGAWSKFLFSPDVWSERYALSSRAAKYRKPAGGADDTADGDGKPETYTDTAAFRRDVDAAKQEAGVPFRWLWVDPLSVYPMWRDGRLLAVLEAQQRPVHETFREYRIKRNGRGEMERDYPRPGAGGDSQEPKDDERALVAGDLGEPEPARGALGGGRSSTPEDSSGASITFFEYWDDRTCSYLVQGMTLPNGREESRKQTLLLDQWEHGYSRVPFFYSPGLMMAHWRNRKVGWSISESKRFLVEYRSFLWTLHAQLAARDTLPPQQRTYQNPALTIRGDDQAPRAERYKPGLIYDNPVGARIEPLVLPDTAKLVREEISLVSQAIEKLETPRVRSDIGGGLEGAGFAINQILTEAKIRHDPVTRSIERMLVAITEFCWRLIKDVVREPVWVYGPDPAVPNVLPGGRRRRRRGWMSLSPEDLSQPVRVEWALDPAQASARLVEARYWHERVGAKTASLDQAIEAMGDNPDEVRLGRAKDEIRETPFYKQRRLKLLAEAAGRGDLIAQAIADEMASTGVVPGAPGQPSMVPPQAAGGAGGTGQASSGAAGLQVPNPAGLAQAPGGVPGGTAPPVPNGAVSGAGPGAVVPQQAAAAGLPSL